MVSAAESRPSIRVRGRSFMALVLAPEPPLPGWLVALDAQIARAPGFFDARPVILDLGLLPSTEPDVAALIQDLADRGIRIIGTEGAHPSWAGVAKWGGPLGPPGGMAVAGASNRPAGRPIAVPEQPIPAPGPVPDVVAPGPLPAPAPNPQADNSPLLVEHALRSGQQVVHEAGDVTILGAVAWGAEVIAGGSIHVYGALRGRAIAGFSGNKGARIFCRRLEAEFLAIDGLYRTAEEWDPALHGRPAQAWLEGETLLLASMD
jgi:septum site-determining protein MinC